MLIFWYFQISNSKHFWNSQTFPRESLLPVFLGTQTGNFIINRLRGSRVLAQWGPKWGSPLSSSVQYCNDGRGPPFMGIPWWRDACILYPIAEAPDGSVLPKREHWLWQTEVPGAQLAKPSPRLHNWAAPQLQPSSPSIPSPSSPPSHYWLIYTERGELQGIIWVRAEKNSDSTHSCPRGLCLSESWESNWGPTWNPP